MDIYIFFSKCMQTWGVLHLNPVDLFFPEKPTENCENQKITWEYLGSPKNILEYSGLKTIEDHSGPMATSGPSSHKMAEISPFELSESVGVDNFIVILREALALFLKMHL